MFDHIHQSMLNLILCSSVKVVIDIDETNTPCISEQENLKI